MYLHPRRTGRSPDRKRLLGVVLPGARNPARWSDAQWQDHWGWWWLFQHLLQRDWRWQARAKSRLRWLGANCCRYVSFFITVLNLTPSPLPIFLPYRKASWHVKTCWPNFAPGVYVCARLALMTQSYFKVPLTCFVNSNPGDLEFTYTPW